MTRRGGAIIAVLFLLVIGIVMASSVLLAADAAHSTAQAELSRTQSRALAWSGVQGLMAELSEQREKLLDGQAPDITPEWDLYTLDDGTRGVIRLIDLAPDAPGVISPENGKLDLNSATAEMLALLPGLGQQAAERIIAARDESPFTSVGRLLRVEGVTPEMLYGPGASDALLPSVTGESPAAEPGGAAPGEGLTRWLTVFSFDPNVQVGLEDAGDHRGALRVNLDQSWSEQLSRAIAERFDQGTADMVKAMMGSGQSFSTDGALARVLVDNKLDPEAWPGIFDVFTTTDDQFLRGRVDVNTAPAEVLACIPGITPEQAAAIVEARDGVDPAARRSPVWLVLEGLLTPEDFVQAADWVTTRSTQWRVRLEAGLAHGDALGFDESAPLTLDQLLRSWDQEPSDALEHRVVLEAVIDVASARPRVAYLREVTLLEPVLAMQRAMAEPAEAGPLPGQEAGPEVETEPSAPEPFDEALEDDPFLLDDPFLGGAPDDGSGMALESPRGADDAAGWGADDPELEARPAPEPGEPPEMIDRRIGRWTTRKAGKP